MGIVGEVIEACKNVLDTTLTGFTRLDYEYTPSINNDRSLSKKYGFISGPANFADGRAIGFTTINHTFTLILVDDYQNQDDDEPLRNTLHNMYDVIQNSLCQLQKSRLQLPTTGNMVLLISGLSFDEPEIISDNSTIVLRANFVIQYKYRNN